MRVFSQKKKLGALNNRKGFSLLEVMIALLLIGVAVAVMVGTVGKTATTQASSNATAAQIIADFTAIDTAVQAYKADLPDPAAGWVTASINAALVAKGYLKQSPPPIIAGAAYGMDNATTWAGVAAGNDTVVFLTDAAAVLAPPLLPAPAAATIPDDVCLAINVKSYGGSATVLPVAFNAQKNVQCYADAPGNNVVVAPVLVNYL